MLSRRRLVVITSAVALLVMGLVISFAFVLATQTSYGRGQLRRLVMSQLRGAVKGTIHVGEIRGGLLTGLTIDSLEIRDDEDSLFVSTGRISVAYDPRDIFDRRILLRHVEVEHPVVYLRQHENGDWNWRRIFPKGARKRASPQRGFGDYIVMDSATVRDAALLLTLPWHPPDSLRGARRDSAVAHNLATPNREIRRTREGLARTYRWTSVQAASSQIRLADPERAGKFFVVSRLDFEESDPPMSVRNASGTIRNLQDSVWLDLSHFDLPGSTGSAKGKVVWGSDLPIRYDVHVIGDSVSLRDVAWVYPTLPRSGGGTLELTIRSARNPRIIDYAVRKMDIRTTHSRLLGDMTFGVGAAVLSVKDVAVQAVPVDFRLLETLNGAPFPYPWAGQFTGTVRARGGPVNRFVVDDARFTFRDANVRDAVTRGSARGQLDILYPALTVFRGFDVEVEQLDLRTLQFLNPSFPRVNGFIAGTARLDSSWLDVRFSEADLTHRDGPAEPTRVTGNGRATWGETFVTWDLALQAEPLSFTTLARSYPALRLRGPYAGPMRIRGTVERLDLAVDLAGAAGRFGVDGEFDLYAPGFAARGRGSVTHLDVRSLLANAKLPRTDLTAEVQGDLAGDSLSTITGALALDVDRSVVDGVLIRPSRARLALGDGVLRVNELSLETTAGYLVASGGIGLTAERRDSLAYSVTIDSLGGLRRYLLPSGPPQGAVTAADSLGGSIMLRGSVTGSLDALRVAGDVDAHDLWVAGSRARLGTAAFDIRDFLAAPNGEARFSLDTLTVSGVRLRHVGGTLTIVDASRSRVSMSATSANGPTLAVAGDVLRAGDSTEVALDSLDLVAGQSHWRLARRARIVAGPSGILADTVVLRGDDAGVLWAGGALPQTQPLRFTMAADSVPLEDIGLLAQSAEPFRGRAMARVDFTGTRDAPVMVMRAALRDARIGDLRLERVNGEGRYANRRFTGDVNLFLDGARVLAATASLPLDLALRPVENRLLDDSLSASIRADSVSLAVIEAFSTSLYRATGTLSTNIDVSGRWRSPVVRGGLRVTDGAVGLPNLGAVRLQHLNADVAFANDSVIVRRLSAQSGQSRADSIALTGSVTAPFSGDPSFDLRLAARNFRAMSKPRVAELDLSGALRMRGALSGSTLTGGVSVDRGDIHIPELAQKDIVSLDDEEFYNVVDTSVYANRALVPENVPPLVDTLLRHLELDNVRVSMGEDVWLRSSEANIKLGGFLDVTRGRSDRPGASEQPALSGTLATERGTYRLNLGLVQRTFEVERGTLRFFGDPDLNPWLDISAIHTVRQASQQSATGDVRIRVKIEGPLIPQPTLTLSSADNIPLSQSDLLSYLVTGAPSFQVENARDLNTVANVLLPSLSYFSDRFARTLSLDVLQLQTSNIARDQQQASLGNLLSGTRLGVGKQVGTRTFLSASAGLCQLASGTASSLGLADFAWGAKVEHQLNHGFSAAVGFEPSSSKLLCTSGTSRGFVPTPPQFGFDLFRAWQF